MQFYIKPRLRLLAALVLLIIAAAAVIFIREYYRYRHSPDFLAATYFNQLERQYREDTYGGETPEKTLQLFTEALKVGDAYLAAKYFLIEQQPEWLGRLQKIRDANALPSLIRDLGTAKRELNINDASAVFSLANQKDEVVSMINIVQIKNRRWKIADL